MLPTMPITAVNAAIEDLRKFREHFASLASKSAGTISRWCYCCCSYFCVAESKAETAEDIITAASQYENEYYDYYVRRMRGLDEEAEEGYAM